MKPTHPADPIITGMQLEMSAAALGAMAAFYRDLGLDVSRESETGLSLRVGGVWLQFTVADGEPFYHFALLVPGERLTPRTRGRPSASRCSMALTVSRR